MKPWSPPQCLPKCYEIANWILLTVCKERVVSPGVLVICERSRVLTCSEQRRIQNSKCFKLVTEITIKIKHIFSFGSSSPKSRSTGEGLASPRSASVQRVRIYVSLNRDPIILFIPQKCWRKVRNELLAFGWGDFIYKLNLYDRNTRIALLIWPQKRRCPGSWSGISLTGTRLIVVLRLDDWCGTCDELHGRVSRSRSLIRTPLEESRSAKSLRTTFGFEWWLRFEFSRQKKWQRWWWGEAPPSEISVF